MNAQSHRDPLKGTADACQPQYLSQSRMTDESFTDDKVQGAKKNKKGSCTIHIASSHTAKPAELQICAEPCMSQHPCLGIPGELFRFSAVSPLRMLSHTSALSHDIQGSPTEVFMHAANNLEGGTHADSVLFSQQHHTSLPLQYAC